MRIPGTATVNRKEPISCDLNQKKSSNPYLDNPVDLRNVSMYVLCFTASFRFDGLLVRIAIFLLEKVSWFFECIKVRATNFIGGAGGGGRNDDFRAI